MKALSPDNRSAMQKIKKRIANDTVNWFMNIIAYVLADKYCFGNEKIKQVLKSIEYQADSVVNGYVSFEDIKKTLKDEYNITIECK